MTILRLTAARLAIIALLALPVGISFGPDRGNAQAGVSERGHVYLVRGLGTVFAVGMDRLAGRLRARGVHASTSNFFSWSRVADRIARDYRSGRIRAPIVIVGHSLGANGALHMAQRLAREDIPVRLLVIFDATEAVPVPRNVADVINFYQPGGWGKPLRGGNGFRGAIRNEAIGRDAGIHSTVDQNDRLHSRVIARVLSLLSR